MNLQDPKRMILVQVWDAMFRGARRAVEDMGFIGVHNAPEIVGITGACENVDTLFKVDYFGKQAYLAQSDQLYLELLTPTLKKVYAEIQSFRMEPEADDRHLTQFSLFEIEHQGDLDELLSNLETIVKASTKAVQKWFITLQAQDPAAAKAVLAAFPNAVFANAWMGDTPFKKITYTESVAYLKAHGFPELIWGDDLKARHEAELVTRYGPVFVTHYPLAIKFFNMKRNAENPDVVNSADLLLPYAGESAGSAEREHDHDEIESRLKSSDMYARLIALGGTDEDFAWYLDAHKGKEIPLHSGAGIGMARVAQYLLGLKDIREATPFLLNSENLL